MRRRRPAAYGAVMIPRSRLLAGAAAVSLAATMTLAACGSSSAGRPQAGLTSRTAGSTSGPADSSSAATCHTPQQLEAAYGVQPLLQRGTDGRGETVVLPELAELAESQLSPPLVTDLRQDYQAGPGWDPVTGWGSSNAQVLVPLLASYASHWRSQHRTTIRTEVKRSGGSHTTRRTS
jgi:hypothetical protein